MIHIKRWQGTLNGHPATFVGDTVQDVVNLFDKGCDITESTDRSYMRFIDLIKQHSLLVRTSPHSKDRERRELYRCDCFLGTAYIKLSLDLNDGQYYNIALVQIWKDKRTLNPVCWTQTIPQKVWENVIDVKNLRYEVHSYRLYGQPKLSKPKELKNVKSIGSATFIDKHCNPQLYVCGDDLWIKHTDYFSRMWRPPAGERVGMPLNYYLKKYFNTNKSEKFVYADNWGSIVLRNEAWLVLRNIMPLINCKEINYWQIADKILSSQIAAESGMKDDGTWERFWENVVKTLCQWR